MTAPSTLCLCLLIAAHTTSNAAPAAPSPALAAFHPPPGQVRTSWVGNSLPGNGGPNGQGFWVQQGADEVTITADGTVIAGVPWDEAGRCVGLYKDGRVNQRLLKEHNGRGKATAWGFGTANQAVAEADGVIWVATQGKQLQRYTWTPGDLESASYQDAVPLNDEPTGLDVRFGRIIVIYQDRLEIRPARDPARIEATIPQAGVLDACLIEDGRLLVIQATAVIELRGGKPTGRRLDGLQRPVSVALGHDGRIVVADDGPDQLVRFYAPSTLLPKGTFGEKGGAAAHGGLLAPGRLFGLRGAGTDREGRLHIAMGWSPGPQGHLFLHSYSQDGRLLWQLHSTVFVDCFDFDASTDGEIVHGRATAWNMDYRRQQSGAEATLFAVTIDTNRVPPDDFRRKESGGVLHRKVGGQTLLAMMGQMGGGYRFYRIPDGTHLPEPAGEFHASDAWAWHLETDGSIWQGDAKDRRIVRFRCTGWSTDGHLQHDRDAPESWPWPEGIERLHRVLYDEKSDTLFVFCHPAGEKPEAWGIIGTEARRYDGWRGGKRALAWRARLPMNARGTDDGRPLSGKCVAHAGDYLFVAMVKADGPGIQYTHILSALSGAYIGSLTPDKSITGEGYGWVDMVQGLSAHRRADGEYLLLVEEDWRGKCLLYRWRPTGP